MTHHILEPEPSGVIGPGAEWTRTDDGERVQADPLRCELAGWLGDDLVDVTPDFVVTDRLADALRASALTGVELRPAIITRSAQFASSVGEFPERWERLVPSDDPGAGTDLARGDTGLLVSERALALLNEHRIVHAHLVAADDTPEAARFARRREEARTARLARLRAEEDAAAAAGAQEAARVSALLRDAARPSPPVMRTSAKREITGDVTLAAAALGARIDEDAALAVLSLVEGPIVVDDEGAGRRTYRSGDGSVQVLVRRGVVAAVQFTLQPHAAARLSRLVDGCDPFTRDAVHERLGAPKSTTTGLPSHFFDEYRLGRKRMLVYWGNADLAPRFVVIGRKT